MIIFYFKASNLMVGEEVRNQNWWSTLPGIITGTATLITAIGGLIVILNANEHLKDTSLVNAAKTISNTVGRFPQASDRLLTPADVSSLSKADLKLMRNEIFARHGFRFKTQEMKSYFQNQAWYFPTNNDMLMFLTENEKRNIELIERYE